MATASGLYSNKVRDIMGGRSSTDDRAADYKEQVEVKATKNKIERIEEQTEAFQLHLLKSTLNSEEYLKKIERHTKTMSKETIVGQIVQLAKLIGKTYFVLKWVFPSVYGKLEKKLTGIFKNSGFGARSLVQCCCCDEFGTRGRMGRANRRRSRESLGRSERPASYSKEQTKKNSQDRANRARELSSSRANRTKQEASDLKLQKSIQLQTKKLQETIKKSSAAMSNSGKSSINAIFGITGGGLKKAATTIGKTSVAAAKTLTKVGAAAIGGLTSAIGGIFTSTKVGAALASKVSLRGLGTIGTGAIVGHNLFYGDHNKQLETNEELGWGRKWSSAVGYGLDTLLLGIPGRSLSSSRKKLDEMGAYGGWDNLSQMLDDVDRVMGKPFGFEEGFQGQIGKALQYGLGSGYNSIKRFFFPVTEELKSQTESLVDNLDSNFRGMKLDNAEARKQFRDLAGANIQPIDPKNIPKGSLGGDTPSTAGFERSKEQTSYSGPSTGFEGGTAGKTAVQRTAEQQRATLFDPKPAFVKPDAEGKYDQGWQSYYAVGHDRAVPSGFTGEAGPVGQRLSVRRASATEGGTIKEVAAAGKGWTTVVGADGETYRRTGARNWRNNNSGNIEYGDFAKSTGAIGSDGRFAIYPTREAGDLAKEKLIFEGKNYKDLSLEHAIHRYAPPSENNTEAYIKAVMRDAGVSRDTLMKDFTPEQRRSISQAITRHEGYKVGRITDSKGNEISEEEYLKRTSAESSPAQNKTAFAALMSPDSYQIKTTIPSIAEGGSAANIAVNMANQNATRNKPLDESLERILQYAAAEAGIEELRVYSGGQDRAGRGARRVGTSTNHDLGHAGDLNMRVGGRNLDYRNEEDRGIIEKFVTNAVKAGARGIGMGPGYMGPEGIHIGNTGNDVAWGAGGKSANAPEWLRRAYNAGIPLREGFNLDQATRTAGDTPVKPSQVEIVSITPKTHEDAVNFYSSDKGLGSIFGINRAAASDSGYVDSGRKGRISPRRSPKDIQNRIDSAFGDEPEYSYTDSGRKGRLGPRRTQKDIQNRIDSAFGDEPKEDPKTTMSQDYIQQRIQESRGDTGKGDKVSNIYQSSMSGNLIQDRISEAHDSVNAHVVAEKIKPSINPQSSILAASEGVTIPQAVDYSSRVPTTNTSTPVNPAVQANINPSSIPHSADPELFLPLALEYYLK